MVHDTWNTLIDPYAAATDFQFNYYDSENIHHHVPAPPKSLIPDDNGRSFSHYIAHDLRDQLSSPDTPLSSSTSSYSELVSGNSTPRPLTPPPPPTPQTPPTLSHVQQEKRRTGACTRCKKMKMKCEFRFPTDSSCQRCKSGRFPCTVEGRKPRTPSQREFLLAQLRQKDATIAALLAAHRPTLPTPLTLAASKLAIPPALRAAHRDALTWAEKGAATTAAGATSTTASATASATATATAQRWRTPFRARTRDPADDRGDSDDSSSADSADSDDLWDDEAARALQNFPPAPVYAHALPDPTAPLGLIARMSLEDDPEGARIGKRGAGDVDAESAADSADADAEEWGVANRAYFAPGPGANLALRRVLNEREAPPAILASGLISWAEARKLFDIFYEYINPYVSVLDPVLHTCSSVFSRCPFLFTVVCAISLRYMPPRTPTSSSPAELHKLALHFAKAAAAHALIDGHKSPELAQAYFLLSIYGPAARRWEEDRAWFYGGLATRVAVDLGLDRAVVGAGVKGGGGIGMGERAERERLNRARTWLICFNVDRSSAVQFGKPSAVLSDASVRGARVWYRGSVYNHPYDVHLVMYVELLRIMSRFLDQIYVDGTLNKNAPFAALANTTESEIDTWHADATFAYGSSSRKHGGGSGGDGREERGCAVRAMGVPLFENYARLVVCAFAFQGAWARGGRGKGAGMGMGMAGMGLGVGVGAELGGLGGEDGGVAEWCIKCLGAASAVVRHMVEVYAPSGVFKYAPDCFFVMGGFCAAFLLKMMRPEFKALVDATQRARMRTLIERLVDVLASPAVALDRVHTPVLYARFLWGQLQAVQEEEEVVVVGEEGVGVGGMGALDEEEYLAAMQAVEGSCAQWVECMLMPGFKWEGGGGGV